MKRNYWGYRIDTKHISFFWDQLENEEVLRQGWGFDESHNLRNREQSDQSRRNRSMYEKVKKGDILLVPRLPDWDEVAIVEATKDWNEGYAFDIDTTLRDYGHIFPAKFCVSFVRFNKYVGGSLRSTLKARNRFWNMNHCVDDIEKLLLVNKEELKTPQSNEDRFRDSMMEVFNKVFSNEKVSSMIYDNFSKKFSGGEWENALVLGLQSLFPLNHVERVGGNNEKKHGVDILMKLPGLNNKYEDAIAIQVKDYHGKVNLDDAFNKISLADEYDWGDELNRIDKWIIITTNEKEIVIDQNSTKNDVKLLYGKDFTDLLKRISLSYIGIKDTNQFEF